VKPIYLNIGIQAQVRAQFEKSSQISLPDFILVSYVVLVAVTGYSLFCLQEDKYEAVCKELNSSECTWKHRGPPNKRLLIVIVGLSLKYSYTCVYQCLVNVALTCKVETGIHFVVAYIVP